ncbi:MAG TPA: hypothetical protein VHB20_16680, partial [Verrucomicrobiae bacterium]|nr:hypothetical protein [Verrucomicrobiae bacterium]
MNPASFKLEKPPFLSFANSRPERMGVTGLRRGAIFRFNTAMKKYLSYRNLPALAGLCTLEEAAR